MNPKSLESLTACKLEPALGQLESGTTVQFERMGYFCVDTRDSEPDHPVFNRAVTLRDPWAKIDRQQKQTAHKKP